MRCQNCGYDNPQGRRYCEECGEKLVDLEALKARQRRRSQREAAIYRREAQKEGLDIEEAERRRRRLHKRTSPWVALLILLVVVAVVVIVVLAVSGGESGPEKAVKEFYNAIRDKDVMTYLKHTEFEVYKMAERGEYQPDPYAEGIEYEGISGSGRFLDIRGSVDASAASGDLTFRVAPESPSDYMISASSGNVSLRFIRLLERGFVLRASTTTGEIKAELPIKITKVDRNRITGVVREGESKVLLETASGDITVEESGE